MPLAHRGHAHSAFPLHGSRVRRCRHESPRPPTAPRHPPVPACAASPTCSCEVPEGPSRHAPTGRLRTIPSPPPPCSCSCPGRDSDDVDAVDALCRGACADIGVVVLSATYRAGARPPRRRARGCAGDGALGRRPRRGARRRPRPAAVGRHRDRWTPGGRRCPSGAGRRLAGGRAPGLDPAGHRSADAARPSPGRSGPRWGRGERADVDHRDGPATGGRSRRRASNASWRSIGRR